MRAWLPKTPAQFTREHIQLVKILYASTANASTVLKSTLAKTILTSLRVSADRPLNRFL